MYSQSARTELSSNFFKQRYIFHFSLESLSTLISNESVSASYFLTAERVALAMALYVKLLTRIWFVVQGNREILRQLVSLLLGDNSIGSQNDSQTFYFYAMTYEAELCGNSL